MWVCRDLESSPGLPHTEQIFYLLSLRDDLLKQEIKTLLIRSFVTSYVYFFLAKSNIFIDMIFNVLFSSKHAMIGGVVQRLGKYCIYTNNSIRGIRKLQY